MALTNAEVKELGRIEGERQKKEFQARSEAMAKSFLVEGKFSSSLDVLAFFKALKDARG